jgi:hypothetical protein
MSIAIHSTNDPLSLVKMKVNFPQFSGSIDQQNQVIKNLMTVNYASQLQQVSNLPSIEICSKFEVIAFHIRRNSLSESSSHTYLNELAYDI